MVTPCAASVLLFQTHRAQDVPPNDVLSRLCDLLGGEVLARLLEESHNNSHELLFHAP